MARKKSAQFDGRANLAQAFYERALRANPSTEVTDGIMGVYPPAPTYPPVPLAARWNPTRHQMAVLRSLADAYESELPPDPLYSTRVLAPGQPRRSRDAYVQEAEMNLRLGAADVQGVRARDRAATQVRILDSQLDKLVTKERKTSDDEAAAGPLERALRGAWLKDKSQWAPPPQRAGLSKLAEVKAAVATGLKPADATELLAKIELLERFQQSFKTTDAATLAQIKGSLPASIQQALVGSKMRDEPSRLGLTRRFAEARAAARAAELAGLLSPAEEAALQEEVQAEAAATPPATAGEGTPRSNPGVTGLALARPNPSRNGQRSSGMARRKSNPWLEHLKQHGGISGFARMSPAGRQQVQAAYIAARSRDNRSMSARQIDLRGGTMRTQVDDRETARIKKAYDRLVKAQEKHNERVKEGKVKDPVSTALTRTISQFLKDKDTGLLTNVRRTVGKKKVPVTRDIVVPTKRGLLKRFLDGDKGLALVPEIVEVRVTGGADISAPGEKERVLKEIQQQMVAIRAKLLAKPVPGFKAKEPLTQAQINLLAEAVAQKLMSQKQMDSRIARQSQPRKYTSKKAATGETLARLQRRLSTAENLIAQIRGGATRVSLGGIGLRRAGATGPNLWRDYLKSDRPEVKALRVQFGKDMKGFLKAASVLYAKDPEITAAREAAEAARKAKKAGGEVAAAQAAIAQAQAAVAVAETPAELAAATEGLEQARENAYLVAPLRQNFSMGGVRGFVDSVKQPANLQKLGGAIAGAALGYTLNSQLAKVEAIAPYAAWGVPVINLAGGAAVAYYGGRQFGAVGNLAVGAGLGLMAHGVLALAGKLMNALGIGSPSASAGFGNLYDQAFDGMGAEVYAAPAGVGRYIETGVSGLDAEVYAAPAGFGAEVYAAPAGFGRYVQTGPNNETPPLPIANQPQTVLPQQINLPAGHSVLQGQTGVIRGGGIWDESVFGRIDSMPGI